MEQKRELSMDEMGQVSGGIGEAYGIETDHRKEKPGIQIAASEEIEPHAQPAGSPNQFPVYCRNCKRLLGYTDMPGTKTFRCSDCKTFNYG